MIAAALPEPVLPEPVVTKPCRLAACTLTQLDTVPGVNVSGISDGVTNALHMAVNGLDARQQSIAANVANLETPGYRARVVNFEDSLRAALDTGKPTDTTISVAESLAATRMNGNNVNIDFELLAEKENVLRQRLVVQALNNKYALLRTAITGQ
jgi:flagellar basal-body rod protein FlgB